VELRFQALRLREIKGTKGFERFEPALVPEFDDPYNPVYEKYLKHQEYETEAVENPVYIFLRGTEWWARKRHMHTERRPSEIHQSQMWHSQRAHRRREQSPQLKQYVWQSSDDQGSQT
jgi:hypothetical protein